MIVKVFKTFENMGSDDGKNDFENPFNLKHSTELTVHKRVHESFEPQFMHSKTYGIVIFFINNSVFLIAGMHSNILKLKLKWCYLYRFKFC